MELKILLTNDDGFTAVGLQTLYRHLHNKYPVTIVAPDRERSAVSHAITMNRPLRTTLIPMEDGQPHWMVDGTPADCVKIAIETLLASGQTPNLVLSGINLGSNLGNDVLYSGTVSAALEGSSYQIPSIAISTVVYDNQAVLEKGAAFIVANLETFATLAANAVLNINLPVTTDLGEYQGVKFTRLGRRVYQNVFEARTDPRGRAYYWMGGEALSCEQEPDSDICAIENGYVSITPLHSDLTDRSCLEKINRMKFSL